jgi:dinuclear metal center YbgI/SA1388 family protein
VIVDTTLDPAAATAPSVGEPGSAALPDQRTASISVGDIVRELERIYPPDTAAEWDSVGLVCGDPSTTVHKILFAIDPTLAVVEEAKEYGAQLLVTHHPLFLHGVHSVATTTAKGRVVHDLLGAGCALYVAHTNADAAAPGVSDALARVIGLEDLTPLVGGPSEGGAEPGAEPAGVSTSTGIGRVGNLPTTVSLHELAMIVAGALPATVQGVRVAGPEVGRVRRVAVCGGAGDTLFDAVRRSGADAYVTADLRHHPALEAREGADGPPWLVDVSHWASEWPWLAGCADRVMAALGSAQTTVEARVSTTRTDPWTMHVPSRGGKA